MLGKKRRIEAQKKEITAAKVALAKEVLARHQAAVDRLAIERTEAEERIKAERKARKHAEEERFQALKALEAEKLAR